MQTCKLIEATAAVCLALAATACQDPPPSLLMQAAIEAGAVRDDAASPQGAALMAERLDLYFGQKHSAEQKAYAAQPQLDAPTF